MKQISNKYKYGGQIIIETTIYPTNQRIIIEYE